MIGSLHTAFSALQIFFPTFSFYGTAKAGDLLDSGAWKNNRSLLTAPTTNLVWEGLVNRAIKLNYVVGKTKVSKLVTGVFLH